MLFLIELAAPFKTRPLRSVYHHVIQIYNPDNYGGKWTEEEDEQLKRSITHCLVSATQRRWFFFFYLPFLGLDVVIIGSILSIPIIVTLFSLVIQYGHQWKKIGEELGRNNSACKDRWRDYFGQGDNKSQGSYFHLSYAYVFVCSTWRWHWNSLSIYPFYSYQANGLVKKRISSRALS